jgi:hypothetical protein
MAHTTKINDTAFIHDGDYGTDIEIVVGKRRLTVPSADLKGFMADWVRNERINALENMTDDEVLGLPNSDSPTKK